MPAPWSCLTCGTMNWPTNRACRHCFAVPWPAPSTGTKDKSGKDKPGAKDKKAKNTPPSAGAQHPAPDNETTPAQQLKALQATRDTMSAAGVAEGLLTQIDAEIERLQELTRDRRPIGQRLDGLRGVVARGEARLLTKQAAVDEAIKALDEERKEVEKHRGQLKELEEELAAPAKDTAALFQEAAEMKVPPWVKDGVSSLAIAIKRGTDMNGRPLDPASIADALQRLVEDPTPVPAQLPVPEEEMSDEPPDPTPVSAGEGNHGKAGTSAPSPPAPARTTASPSTGTRRMGMSGAGSTHA